MTGQQHGRRANEIGVAENRNTGRHFQTWNELNEEGSRSEN